MNGFVSPTQGQLSLDQLISAISQYIQEKPNYLYRLVIGTDSQVKVAHSTTEISFVTAIVIQRIGSGGRYFWSKEKRMQKMVLRDRIYTETLLSLALAEVFVPKVRRAIPDNSYELEIHIDVGPNGATREMIREVVGMVAGNGYVAKTKPESFGAYVVADRYT